MKAAAIIEMPDRCIDCDFSFKSNFKKKLCCILLCRQYENVNAVECVELKRRDDCPLKPIATP